MDLFQHGEENSLATFVEQKATIISSQPFRESSGCTGVPQVDQRELTKIY